MAKPGHHPGRALLFLTLSGLATGASWVCYFRALKVGEASRVAPIDKLSVVLVAVFAVIFLGERPGAKDWAGIALVGVGVLLLVCGASHTSALMRVLPRGSSGASACRRSPRSRTVMPPPPASASSAAR